MKTGMGSTAEAVRERRWVEQPEPDRALVERIQKATGQHPLVCRLMAKRGLADLDEIRSYFKPSDDLLHDPFLMKDVGLLVEQLLEARRDGERILIHGDYDVDGLSSTTLLTRFLHARGFRVDAFVPHRKHDGYGISMRVLERELKGGLRTVLTCDTGISEAAKIRSLVDTYGARILVTDHHHVPEDLPPAAALVNPHQSDCAYPFKYLCGAGVAFKVLQALVCRLVIEELERRTERTWSMEDVVQEHVPEAMLTEVMRAVFDAGAGYSLRANEIDTLFQHNDKAAPIVRTAADLCRSVERVGLFDYLDLVALGTIADVVPLVDENRVLARLGLRRLRRTTNPGLLALLRVADVAPENADEWTCGFVLGPRLNAIGRLDDAGRGLDLLLTDDDQEAADLARILNDTNEKRKAITEQIEREAVAQVEQMSGFDDTWALALYGQDWHHGIVGIVASRIVERFGRPAFLFAPENPEDPASHWKGSGRAPRSDRVHLYEILSTCRQHMHGGNRFGGHAAAAGATLAAADEEGRIAFAAAFNDAARAVMTEEDRIPRVHVDMRISLAEVTDDLHGWIQRFAPFGEQNQAIHLWTTGVRLTRRRTMGAQQQHVKLWVEQDGVAMEAIGWNMADRLRDVMSANLPARVDLVFRIEENTFQGRRQLELRIVDARLGSEDEGGAHRLATPAAARLASVGGR
jgi:single-stranded-DNA-specific exonuclease